MLLLSAEYLQAQGEPVSYLNIGVERNQFLDKSGTGLQISLDVPASERFYLHYSMALGIADNSGYYAHVPIPLATSAVGLFVLALNSNDLSRGGLLAIGALLVASIPEGVSYRVHTTSRTELWFDVCPLSLYFYHSQVENRDPIVPKIGASIMIKNKDVTFLKLQGSILYQISTNSPGIQFGASYRIRL